MDPLESLWASLLSRDPSRIRDTWQSLSREEQDAIHAHLTRMVTDDGWADPQRISARAALDTVSDLRTLDDSADSA